MNVDIHYTANVIKHYTTVSLNEPDLVLNEVTEAKEREKTFGL